MKKIITMLVALILLISLAPVYAAAGWETDNGGDRVSLLKNLNIDKNMAGDIVAIGGNADIKADINGDVVVVAGDLKLDATVTGDVVSVFGKVTLADKARIMGDMVAIGSVNKAGEASIKGEDVIINLGNTDIFNSGIEFLLIFRFVILFVSLLLLMVFGLPVIYFASKRFMVIEAGIEYGKGKKFLIGFLGMIAGFIITLLLSWTVIVPLVFLIVVFLAKLAAYIYIGKMAIKISNARLNMYIEFITGVIAIMLVKIIMLMLIPQGYIILGLIADLILNTIVNSIGLGILVDSKFGKSEF